MSRFLATSRLLESVVVPAVLIGWRVVRGVVVGSVDGAVCCLSAPAATVGDVVVLADGTLFSRVLGDISRWPQRDKRSVNKCNLGPKAQRAGDRFL